VAEIFRPTYTVTDPKTGKRIKKKSRTWHIRYYTPDGQRPRVKGYRDKKATETLAAPDTGRYNGNNRREALWSPGPARIP
jgi:hypothetical protein